MQQAQAFIEKNLDEKISIEQLSAEFAVGRRNFDRRFIKATGNSPIEYAQRVKIEAAKKAFETNRKTINEVMFDILTLKLFERYSESILACRHWNIKASIIRMQLLINALIINITWFKVKT